MSSMISTCISAPRNGYSYSSPWNRALHKIALASALLSSLLTADMAWAVERHAASSLSCATAWNTIQTSDAIIIRRPSSSVPGLTLYDRYVRNAFQCSGNEVTASKTVSLTGGETCELLACERGSHHGG